MTVVGKPGIGLPFKSKAQAHGARWTPPQAFIRLEKALVATRVCRSLAVVIVAKMQERLTDIQNIRLDFQCWWQAGRQLCVNFTLLRLRCGSPCCQPYATALSPNDIQYFTVYGFFLLLQIYEKRKPQAWAQNKNKSVICERESNVKED